MLVAAAAWVSYLVAKGVVLSTAHRAAAAWTALLVVAALAILAQAILLWYQAKAGAAPDTDSSRSAAGG